MKDPDLYLFGPIEGGMPNGAFSNLDWGKEETLKRAKTSGKTQVLYKLVPVHRVDVKVTQEFIISPE